MQQSIGFLLFLVLLLIPAGCKNESKKSPTGMMEAPIQKENLKLLVGTFAEGDGQGIYQLDFNPETGELTNSRRVAEENKPGYLYLSKDGNRVYSSNGTKPGSVSAFQWNKDKTALNRVGNLPSIGDGACYVGVSPEEHLLAAANYSSGSIVLYPLDEKGGMIDDPQGIQHNGSGPHPNQKSAHAHCVQFSQNGKFLYAVDLGIDQVLTYPIDSDNKLGEAKVGLQLDPGDGPRHLVFHPTQNMVFIINELSSTVVSATVDEETGVFTTIDKKSTLPDGYQEPNACADIHISKDGKFLYASNRGHNSIAVYSVSESGELKLLTIVSVQGDWPRNFTLSPDGNFLLVANQKSDNITVFEVDKQTGLLNYTGNQIHLPQPVCLKF
ncbi:MULTISPECIES: lactonase family protein [unclassified Arenibacter]|uniref:lactonase family protein n=1 Tax=unclassified Arenibacter TaxID=2615047 RepID=UPI000E3554B6|nr:MULTISPECIES: lactonase family protein [unclassified Arenibacter]MCM4162467.1 6-phosphogluconolactonase [Arenibacter sp. A80]RFT58058.1 lactonase family protein [Arenibacter sp. P308M17]